MDKTSGVTASVGGTMMNDPDELLRPREAARLLGLSERSLENFRTRGDGPEFERLTPKAIRYSRRALREWRAARACRSTADYEGDHAR